MVEKRPHPDGQGPSGDVKRVKAADAIAAARAKAAEIAARAAAKKNILNGAPTASVPTPAASTAPTNDSAARLAALRARMEAMKKPVGAAPAVAPSDLTPRFVTSLGNQRAESPTANPNLAPTPSRSDRPQAQDDEPVNPYYDPKNSFISRPRLTRELVFNEHGKYLDQASKLRAQSRLEQIKKMLAIQARRAGLDENSERGFLVQPPPDIEWWDEGLLSDKNYGHIDNPKQVKIDSDDSIITLYIQHPPLLKAPQDQRLIQVKPMYLTTKEQAKLRRMRRAADLKEHQAKIRLGLEPPPPPKVKRGNMMRVMGEQAIADPTAVEMLVESQIAQRHENHVAANAERKLTKEQIQAKLAANQEKDAAKGLYMCVFKINSLAFGKHRYQVDQNAKQLALTGLTLFNPRLNLVVVEGGIHSVTKYKKLLLHRMNWTENAAPSEAQAEKQARDPVWLRATNESGELRDLGENKCILVFEGEVKTRAFRKWGSRMCETDGEAREVLGRSKLDSLWGLAQSLS